MGEPGELNTATTRFRFGTTKLPSWRREALRTTFWLVPTVLVVVACLLFLVTFQIDLANFHHQLTLPFWIRTGRADAGRQVLIAIAAAVITVVGVVFSITILALTLASQQFGPRMMRNFIRDIGNQLTLGIFVGTFVYSVLALGSITNGPHGDFVPHLSITFAEALLLVDLGVLIYFIHHIAKSIQLPEVIAGIARDLTRAIDAEFPLPDVEEHMESPRQNIGRSVPELVRLIDDRILAVRGLCPTRRHCHPHRLSYPTGSPTRTLHRTRPAVGHCLARWRGRTGGARTLQSERDRAAPHLDAGPSLCH